LRTALLITCRIGSGQTAQHQVNGDAAQGTVSTPPVAQRPQSEHQAADDHQLAVQRVGAAQPGSGL